MTLNSSGAISLGGSVTGQSINLELGQSATAQNGLGDDLVRTLLGVSSGAISMSSGYSKTYTAPAYFIAQIILPAGTSGVYSGVTGSVDSSGNIYWVYGRYNETYTYFRSLNAAGSAISDVKNNTVTPHLYGTVYSDLDSSNNVWLSSYVGAGTYGYQKYSSSFAAALAKRFTTASAYYGLDIMGMAFDSSGNMYANSGMETDYYTGPCACMYVYESHDFIWKVNASTGAVTVGEFGTTNLGYNWCRTFGRLSIDSSNNIYRVVGVYAYNPPTYPFIQKFNTSLALVSQYSIATSISGAMGKDVVTDSAGNIYVTIFSASAFTTFALVKMDSSFTVQWARLITKPAGTTYLTPLDIAKDSSDNIYILCASFSGFTDVKYAIFKYNSSGTIQWQRLITPSLGSFNVPTYQYNWYNFGQQKLVVNSTGLYIFTAYRYSGQAYPWMIKLPLDGSRTGTYSLNSVSYTYAAWTATEASTTVTTTSASGPSYSLSTPGLTTYTNQASSSSGMTLGTVSL